MHRAPLVAILFGLAAFAGCIGEEPAPTTTTTPPPPVPQLAFNVTEVDATLDVSEPSLLVDPAGTVWIAGPTGLAKAVVEKDPSSAKHDSALFKSTDHGATWENVQQIPMYGRDTCPGGGDSDIAATPDGRILLIDLYLGNVPIDVSSDGGKTWLFNCYT
ncbi:MAG: glycoside hydrolase, partial [Halobacteriales archaeon]|nr:glycoside hydrolase [Halobacteriales archaeon]